MKLIWLMLINLKGRKSNGQEKKYKRKSLLQKIQKVNGLKIPNRQEAPYKHRKKMK